MDDFASARAKMVDSQLRTEGVTDFDLLAAMGSVPRERFVPPHLKALAYIDEDIPLKPATATSPTRYLMEPAPFARLVQLAEIGPTETVLIIGAGCGYSAAVIAHLAASVIALESDPDLAAAATANLGDLGIANARVVTGQLESGWPAEAPYPVIIIEGSVQVVPDALFDQLAESGRLVAVVGYGRSAPAMIFTKDNGEIGPRPAFDADVRPIPGFQKVNTFVF